MAEVTNEELSIQIASLRHHLRTPDGGWLPTTNWLKEQLGPLTELKKKIDDMHQELTKAKKTELLEGMGLDGFAAALEKYYEKSEYWGYYLGAAVASFLVPVVGLMMLTNFTNFQRAVQGLFFNLIDKIPGVNTRGRILAINDGNTLPRLQDAQQVRAREEAAGGGMASIPADANFEPLRRQLEALNPHLKEFNTQAGPFRTKFKDLPKAGAMTKAADAIDRIKTAVAAFDPPKTELVATAVGKLIEAVKDYDPKKIPDPKKIEKLNAAMVDANPTQIKAMATATGKLASAQRHFDPKKLPKARGLESAARAAERLAKAGGDVAQAFNNLKLKAQETAQALA
ncbi:hypothetical protein ABZY68_19725 [Streptomyces sp. NPDC006482]|uniref:hypothetical protein n=1 Tax=unclassified Streptomyces TaxID=2593676 RepID=UPI00225B1D4D|nr:hypothetical protein [Streptomyces sp. NBC_00094]MCX5392551.1 hypothetical protein [Streptomyces sp. NBC_00094]